MKKHLSVLVVVLFVGVACGKSDNGPSTGGSSAGGKKSGGSTASGGVTSTGGAQGGSNVGGATSAGGTVSGGTVSGGTVSGGTVSGGATVTDAGVGSGGAIAGSTATGGSTTGGTTAEDASVGTGGAPVQGGSPATDGSTSTGDGGVTGGGLVAYWKFDEPGASDICVDSSGNGHDGTPSASIVRGEGKFGAHSLSVTCPQVVNVKRTLPFPSYPMSVSAWVRPKSVATRQYIFTYLPDTAAHSEYEFALYLEKSAEPRAYIWGRPIPVPALQDKIGLVSPVKATSNAWLHLVVTMGDPTGSSSVTAQSDGAVNQTWKLYENGKVTVSQILPFPIFQAIGGWAIAAKPSGSDCLNGDIDELRIFNKALTEAEVTALFTTNTY